MNNRQAKHFYEFGPFRVDATEQLLLRDGVLIPLTPKAFDTLLILAENSGHLVEKDELMKRLWPDTFVEEANLAHNISVLRKAFGENSDENKYIQTVPRRGYRFVGQVKESWEEESHPSEKWRAGNSERESEAQPPSRADARQEQPAPTETAVITPPIRARSGARRAFQLVAASVLIVIAAIAIVWLLRRKPDVPAVRLVPFTSYAGSERHPAFSPDGSRIAFTWDGERGENSDIYVKLITAGPAVRLTTDPAIDYSPVWSPDGSQIAFLRRSPASVKDGSVYLISSLGGPERKLADFVRPVPATDKPDWSPDGKFLALAARDVALTERDVSLNQPCIFLLSVATGEWQKLTTPPTGYRGDSVPVFSPDGYSLAFRRARDPLVSEVYLMPVSGGEARQLTSDKQNIGPIAWTADGREIVFRSNREGGNSRFWKIPVSGGEPALVSEMGERVTDFNISKRGNRLAYTQQYYDRNIWRVEVTSAPAERNQPKALITSTRDDRFPQFSPDGRRITFSSDRSGNAEIWASDSTGSNAVQLTSFGGPDAGTPRWSHDGKFIAFDAGPGGMPDIYIVKATGGQLRRLTAEDSRDVTPSWSTDGQWIYFASNRSASWQVWKSPSEGGNAVQVTRQGGFGPLSSPDGRFIYYTKDFGIDGLIWRIPSDGGAEEVVPGFTKQTAWSTWALTDRGIFFINPTTGPHSTIEFFDFGTRKYTTIATLEKQRGPGFAVSPDGRWILYTQVDRSESDIMLLENVR